MIFEDLSKCVRPRITYMHLFIVSLTW